MKNTLTFNKPYIESFATQIDSNAVKEFQTNICMILNDCLYNLQTRSTNILNYKILLVGDSVCECETQESEIDIFLIIQSPRLELNTINSSSKWYKKVAERFKYAWEHRYDNKKISRRKRRKLEQKATKKHPLESSPKYNYDNFRYDLLKALAQYFSQSTILKRKNFCINIVGKDDLLMPVNVYVVLNNDEFFKMFNSKKYKFFSIDFGQRFFNISEKLDETANVYRDVLRIYNAIYDVLMDERPNMILLESVLYNCPDNLFVKDDIYQAFLNTANYLFVTSPFQLKSICNERIRLYQENLCKNDIHKFMRFLNKLRESLN